MVSNSVAKLLNDSAELKPLAERLERVKRLQKTYRTLAPEDLAKASRVSAIDGSTVVVSATTGAVAAALKQLAPRLLRGLRDSRNSLIQNENQELTAIRVEVQVDLQERRRTPIARGQLPLEKLSTMAEGLEDSPLKATLERIAKRPHKSRTREKT
ncbi:DciA family protein [Usitatibacter palustris]|uniref:DciA family protein n=1 Tax=Usitatibacter palustris TaxID=2732487 RepID=UPI0014881175|nr:DciA family protein [Usitatibacter palustris]